MGNLCFCTQFCFESKTALQKGVKKKKFIFQASILGKYSPGQHLSCIFAEDPVKLCTAPRFSEITN